MWILILNSLLIFENAGKALSMPAAILRESISSRSNVDELNGVVSGCKLAEVGKKATFMGVDGRPESIEITPGLISSLLAICSEDNRIPGHWTHGWVNGKSDPLESRVVTWRNFSQDTAGNLIADAFVWPGEKRDAILHAAQHDPEGMMVSMVFDYTGTPQNPIAQSVAAADFVAKGAATTALCCAVLSALSKTAKLDMPDPNPAPDPSPAPAPAPAAPFTPEQISAIQQIVQALLNPPDADLGAAMPAMMSAIRKEVGTQITANETHFATMSEAAATRAIGGKAVLTNLQKLVDNEENPLEKAVSVQLSAGAPNRGVAIARALRDKPELEQYREEIRVVKKSA